MKTIGVIGGMGPQATVDFFQKILNHSDAKTDQENIHVLIDNNPQIPDRTASILDGGLSPVPTLLDMANKLEVAGADFLVIPCNTSHYFYENLAEDIDIPILNMLDLVVEEIVNLGHKKVAVLATRATINTRIYQDKLEAAGIEVLELSEDDKSDLMYLIYDVVKANKYPENIDEYVAKFEGFADSGAEAFVLACTELPILFDKYNLDFTTIDSSDVLAQAAVQYAKN